MTLRRAVYVTLALANAPARAETPRSIGRAGVGTASDDGAGALIVNPAGLARREGLRAQLALGVVDSEVHWLHSNVEPVAADHSSMPLLPLIALQGDIGGELVIGAGVMTTAHDERRFRRPLRIPPEDYAGAFDYRYGGFAGSSRQDTLALSVAKRLGDTLAIGITLAGSRLTVGEERRLWAGDVARDMLEDPRYDVDVIASAMDRFVPSAIAGLLVAPGAVPLELAASVAVSAPALVRGDVAASVAESSPLAIDIGYVGARMELDQPIIVRTGARWLGERAIAEIGADVWLVPDAAAAPRWTFDDFAITDNTMLGVPRTAAVKTLPSRMSSRTHTAIRGALDVELLSGFLWATGGYAFTSRGTAGARLSPTFGDLGGHTLALGLEATAGGMTLTLGWSRTWSVKTRAPTSAWRYDNPFGTGDGPVPSGVYDGSIDMLGLSLDAELEHSD